MAAVTSRRVATSILRRVLIVDDNIDLADNIAEILRIDGHATQVAASAEEGLSKALENEPDVVVTDFRLPGISGAAFVKEFLARRIHVRAMVISAYTDDKTIEEATAAGAEFMGKPGLFAPERLGWRRLCVRSQLDDPTRTGARLFLVDRY